MRNFSDDRPAGNPVETAATGIWLPDRASTAAGTISWYTQIAPVVIECMSNDFAKSGRNGFRALAHRRLTRSSVSSPDNVVKSIQEMARSNHAAWNCFLTLLRVPRVDARRSIADWFALADITQSKSRS